MKDNEKRTAHVTLSIRNINHEFIQKYGHVKKTANGRYNFSEVFDGLVTQIRSGHSPEQVALELGNRKEELEAELLEIEDQAKGSLGTTLDVFLLDMKSRKDDQFDDDQKERLHRATERAEFLEKLFKISIKPTEPGAPPRDMRKLLSNPGWKEDLRYYEVTLREALAYIKQKRAEMDPKSPKIEVAIKNVQFKERNR